MGQKIKEVLFVVKRRSSKVFQKGPDTIHKPSLDRTVMMQHTFVAWSFWRGHPHRYGSWGIWNITQISSKRMVRWKQSMVGFSYLLSQENNLVLRRVATCWFSLVSSFDGCSRIYVSSPVLASLMSILSSNAKSALSICSDSIASLTTLADSL
jgi:hypothetical protein